MSPRALAGMGGGRRRRNAGTSGTCRPDHRSRSWRTRAASTVALAQAICSRTRAEAEPPLLLRADTEPSVDSTHAPAGPCRRAEVTEDPDEIVIREIPQAWPFASASLTHARKAHALRRERHTIPTSHSAMSVASANPVGALPQDVGRSSWWRDHTAKVRAAASPAYRPGRRPPPCLPFCRSRAYAVGGT